jgi:hypothetical protein
VLRPAKRKATANIEGFKTKLKGQKLVKDIYSQKRTRD